MAHGADVREHINNFIEVVDKLRNMDIEIHKDLQSAMLLSSLSDTYENFRRAIELRDELPDLETLKIKILEESETRKQRHNDEPGATAANQNEQGKGTRPSASSVQEMFYVSHVEMEQACAIAMDSEHNNWCLDSGCTKHLCKDKGKFVALYPSKHKKLNLASHMSANVETKGNVQIQTNLDNNIKNIEFQDALYVSDLRVNLASIAQITERNNVEIFTKANRVGNLYYI
ncbi:uncharacterized protein LOC143348227 [Colletes latitarsis]|uniref:uncharacterized protein LOC143348227 n=1 Tax=Colletes latitarsis TaxID=2605962 RepID=UPI004036EFB9